MPRLFFQASYETLVRALGLPVARGMDSNGWGPVDVWTLDAPCGIEIGVWSLIIDADGSVVPPHAERATALFSAENDVAHLAHHFPAPLRDMSITAGHAMSSASKHWSLTRQDDNGNVFLVATYSSSCESEAALARFEALGHKQTYFVARAL